MIELETYEASYNDLLTAGALRHAGTFETVVFKSAARSRDGLLYFGKDTAHDELRLEAQVKLRHDAEDRTFETLFWWQEPQAGFCVLPSVNGTLGQTQGQLNSVAKAEFRSPATAMRAVVSPDRAAAQFGSVSRSSEAVVFMPTELHWDVKESLVNLAVRQFVGMHIMGIVRKKVEDATLPSRKSKG